MAEPTPPAPPPPPRQRAEGSYIAQADRGGTAVVRVILHNHLTAFLVLLLALLALVAGLGAYGYREFFRGDTRMSGLFNIAVADFGQDDGGAVTPSPVGRELSRHLFDSLSEEVAQLPPEVRQRFRPQVWHDRLPRRDKRVPLRFIAGNSPQARAERAEQLADQIGADILIYGTLAHDQHPPTFVPEFYVRDIRGEADEIVGAHQLGTAIPVHGPLDGDNPRAVLRDVNSALLSRNTIMVRFAIGLVWESLRGPDSALRAFQQIEQDVSTGALDWSEDEGLEILYFFIGREQGLLKQYDASDASLRRALEIKDGYARARIGLGNNSFWRAEALPADQIGASRELAAAIAAYEQALRDATSAALQTVAIKAHVGLGSAHYWSARSAVSVRDYQAAEAALDVATRHSTLALDAAAVAYARHAGNASLNLGAIYNLRSYVRYAHGDAAGEKRLLELAVAAYDRCVDVATTHPGDRVLTGWASERCQPERATVVERLRTLP